MFLPGVSAQSSIFYHLVVLALALALALALSLVLALVSHLNCPVPPHQSVI